MFMANMARRVLEDMFELNVSEGGWETQGEFLDDFESKYEAAIKQAQEEILREVPEQAGGRGRGRPRKEMGVRSEGGSDEIQS